MSIASIVLFECAKDAVWESERPKPPEKPKNYRHFLYVNGFMSKCNYRWIPTEFKFKTEWRTYVVGILYKIIAF